MSIINQMLGGGGGMKYARGSIPKPANDTSNYPFAVNGLAFTPLFVILTFLSAGGIRCYICKLIDKNGNNIWFTDSNNYTDDENQTSSSIGTITISENGISGVLNYVYGSQSSMYPIRFYAIGV